MTYSTKDLLFVPLGGAGEIGMNVNLYHYQDSWIMVDLGISFPDDSNPGVDIILPDLKFIAERREKLAGLILTLDMKIILGPFHICGHKLAVRFMAVRLRWHYFAVNCLSRVVILIFRKMGMNAPRKIGAFEIEMIELNHSIPDPAALAIRSAAGTILHTGDWKFDKAPVLGTIRMQAATAVGDAGVLAMVVTPQMPWLMGEPGRKARRNLG